MTLDRTKVGLGALLASTLALAGVPGLVAEVPPSGPLRGVVVDSSGFALADARVFLFREDEERLVGETSTDSSGEFRFALVPPRPRVFVRAPAGSGRMDAFGPSAQDAGASLAFVLHRARALTVRVRDEAGQALAAAEVRVYEERGEAAVLALAHTDERGEAHLGAPSRAHVAVVAPQSGLMRWAFDLTVPEEGRSLEFVLPSAHALHGRVLARGEPVAGVALVAWEDGAAGDWNGHATSAADGSFTLPRTHAPLTLRAVDPLGRFLPTRLALAPDGPTEVELELAAAELQIVRVARAGRPLVARVFVWCEAAGTFGYGLRTNGAGRIELPVPEHFSLHAAPLDQAQEPIEAFDLGRTSSEIRLDPARP